MRDTFRILTVCTGNICRSPLAQMLLARDLADVEGVVVDSAGTHAQPGAAMSEPSQEIARSLGIDSPEQHQAQRLTEDLLSTADLILAMDRGHKRLIVELNPRVTKRVFTLREFARLAQATTEQDLALEVTASEGPARLKQTVTAVGLSRGLVAPPESPEELDVIDPFRQEQAVYERSTQEILPAVTSTVKILMEALP